VRERRERGECRRHIALARIRRAHPIAEACRLGDAAPDIIERDAADNLATVVKNEKRISEIGEDLQRPL
jgi:hypothetical protein